MRLLPLAILILAGTAREAAAQGLRESVVEFLDEVEGPGRDPCFDLDRAGTLLDEIEAAEAGEFMGEELTRLYEQQVALGATCQAWRLDGEQQLALRALLARCEQYGEARAFCRVTEECATVQHMSPRIAAFWQISQDRCPR
jgi:hypothetical protein